MHYLSNTDILRYVILTLLYKHFISLKLCAEQLQDMNKKIQVVITAKSRKSLDKTINMLSLTTIL